MAARASRASWSLFLIHIDILILVFLHSVEAWGVPGHHLVQAYRAWPRAVDLRSKEALRHVHDSKPNKGGDQRFDTPDGDGRKMT